MTCQLIICDWNGTLIEDRDEKPLFETVAKDLFKSSTLLHPHRMMRIIKARQELKALYLRSLQETTYDFVKEIYRIYNDKIIKGLASSFIYQSVNRYALRKKVQRKLDYRVLESIKECRQKGISTGILSAGYKYGIEKILEVAGYNKYFDFFKADDLKVINGKAITFELNIYNNKPGILLDFLEEKGIVSSAVAYIGDSTDDEGCFEIVGHPIVSFMAPDKQKQYFEKKYNAFVPSDKHDLLNYLMNI